MLQNKHGNSKSVVTIFCDSNKKYLSTDLLKEEPVKEGFYSSDVEFLEVIAHKRAFAN
jgi:cysteine synthase A